IRETIFLNQAPLSGISDYNEPPDWRKRLLPGLPQAVSLPVMKGAVNSNGCIMDIPHTLLATSVEPPAREFCCQHDLSATLEQAIGLAGECFPSVRTREVLLREDPENDEEWLSLTIVVSGSIEEALRAYECYVQKWVETIPWPKRAMVRLSYRVA